MGSGFRTFASGEVLTAANVQDYLMDQAVMVFAGTAARGSALPSPETGMTAYSTATGLQVYDGNDWVDVSTGYGAATGGTAISPDPTIDGIVYRVLQFTGDGTLTVTKAGLFDVMVCAGGGSGGIDGGGGNGAGGGAGALVISTLYIDANKAVTVGAGGAGSSTYSRNGTGSCIGTLLGSAGGGGGGGFQENSGYAGKAGGSGGGAFGGREVGIAVMGFGGNVGGSGGGGGAGAAGGAANGGAGVEINTFIGGSSLFKAGGGGGRPSGTGGSSIGGAAGSAASANTASGGGGGASAGSNGGSGIVYVRFKV
jgi:hypothetical protein